MQGYISSNPETIYRFKLALWNLIQWDIAGIEFFIPDNGFVESCGSDDPEEAGWLGWIQDWCIRPATGKSLFRHSLQGQIGVFKYRRRTLLTEIYLIEDADDYPYGSKYFKESPLGLGLNTLNRLLKVGESRGNSGAV